MDSLFIFIPIVLVLIGIGVKLFFWAVDNKQFDDLDSAAQSILFDDDLPPQSPPADDPATTKHDE